MRTTVDLPEDVMRRAREVAAAEGIPLRSVFERALRGFLDGSRVTEGYEFQWKGGPKGAFVGDFDPDSRREMLDHLDRLEPDHLSRRSGRTTPRDDPS